jgi:hypothetical protein
MVGYQAGENNLGSNNVFLGKATGKGAGSGAQTIAIGQGVMETASEASNSVFIGNFMAANCTAGSGSTVAIGTNCLSAAGYSAEFNTVVGHQAGNGLTSGDNNTFIGANAGDANDTGANNIAIGYQAMDINTDGNDNVAIGYGALGAETSGDRNTAIGYGALNDQNQTFAASNTAVGYLADDKNATGFQRTCIGAESGATGAGPSGQNITNIGYSAQESAATASNEVTLGNSSVATLRCQVTTITALSDERDKTSIEDLPYGLDFVDSLKPRKFIWDHRAETNRDGEEFFSANKGKKDIGFIAQELQSVDDDFLNLIYDSNPEKLEATYGRLIPVLVKAIQDLSAKVTALENA